MRRLILLAGLALAVGVLLPASALPAAGGSDLPFKGKGSGSATLNLVTGQSHVVSSGQFTHFGLIAFEQDGRLVPTGAGTFSWSGTWTATAANGDQMFGTSTGTATTTDGGAHFLFVADYVSTGGTGRFANASLTFTAVVPTTHTSTEGAISRSTHVATIVGRLSYR